MNHLMMSVSGNFLQWLSGASHPVCVPFLANLKLLFHSSCLLKGFVKCGRAKPRLCLVRLCFVWIHYSQLRFHQSVADDLLSIVFDNTYTVRWRTGWPFSMEFLVGRLLLKFRVWNQPFHSGEWVFTSGDLRLHGSREKNRVFMYSLVLQRGLGCRGNNPI